MAGQAPVTLRQKRSKLRAPKRRDYSGMLSAVDEAAVRLRRATATLKKPVKEKERSMSPIVDALRSNPALASFVDSLPISVSEMSACTDKTLTDNLKTFTAANYVRYVREKLISDALASCYVLADGVQFVVLEKPNDGNHACYFLLATDGSRIILERTPEDSILIITGPRCSNVRYVGLEYGH
ncbi:hypothetical protein L596_013508 [Steinernema carpocapsae]|uniref:Uncharacterized protein n=1 Tax=Steinernema carpocapsae TaxID=34508 RepID=A0A4U5P0V5_STECR|nr:hypothetical protein L596_013508 [Steinernema carpocapsae]